MTIRGEVINKSRQAKRARRILARLRKGKKASKGPLTRQMRVHLRKDR